MATNRLKTCSTPTANRLRLVIHAACAGASWRELGSRGQAAVVPNITLVPTRKSEALLLAAQRGR